MVKLAADVTLVLCGALVAYAAPASKSDSAEKVPVAKPADNTQKRGAQQNSIQQELERLAREGSAKVHGWDRKQSNAIPGAVEQSSAPAVNKEPSPSQNENSVPAMTTGESDLQQFLNILSEETPAPQPMYHVDQLVARMRIKEMIRRKVKLDQLIQAMMEDYYLTYGPGSSFMSSSETDEILEFLARALYENAELSRDSSGTVPDLAGLESQLLSQPSKDTVAASAKARSNVGSSASAAAKQDAIPAFADWPRSVEGAWVARKPVPAVSIASEWSPADNNWAGMSVQMATPGNEKGPSDSVKPGQTQKGNKPLAKSTVDQNETNVKALKKSAQRKPLQHTQP